MGNSMGGMTPRAANDAYLTPDALALAIAAAVRDAFGDFDAVIEPSAGAGAFVRAARATWRRAKIVAVEPFDAASVPPLAGMVATPLHDAGADVVRRERWETAREFWEGAGERTLTIGNPPFALGEAHLRLALERSRPGDVVAMLFRASMLASTTRVRGLWRAWSPARVWHLAPRPSFTPDGASDSSEYVAIAWHLPCDPVGYVGGWLDWRTS